MTTPPESPVSTGTASGFRPLRWAAIATCIAILALAAVWLWWAHVAGRRLQVQVESILAQGEPLYPRDFTSPPVPGTRNAATYLQAAMTAVDANATSPANSSLMLNDNLPLPPAWQQMADQAMAANSRALSLARQARAFDQVDWGAMSSNRFGILNPARQLANLLGDAALHDHLHGDDAEAIDRLRDVLHEADVLDHHSDILPHLVAMAIRAVAYEKAEVIAPDLELEGAARVDAPATRSARPVRRKVLRQLIAELLDEDIARRQQRLMLFIDRREAYDAFQQWRREATILRPMLDLDAVRVLASKADYLRALEQPTWPAARAILSARPASTSDGSSGPFASQSADASPPRYTRMLRWSVGGPTDQYVKVEYQSAAERRVAATALAIRLYRADHSRWPTSLQALVPEYLSAVPGDPLSTQNRPLSYIVLPGALPDGSDRPLIFFAAPNSASPGSPPTEPIFGWMGGEGTQWCDLSRWSPRPESTPDSH